MLESVSEIRARCAEKILHLYKMANAGHIGSSLSCLEILVDLNFRRMSNSDYLILSKGHAACALYVTLAESGRLPGISLETFYKNNTLLAAHPPCSGEIASIPFGTGSLGHGLSLATGLALSQKFTKKNFQVFAVLSDGDCNEGSTWEAALFAGHHKLSNLTVIVDANGIQGIGRSADILNMEPFDKKWSEFGFETVVVPDGNNFESLQQGFASLAVRDSQKPKCILARTVKGHGVSFMQNTVDWHYLPMNETQYAQAQAENQQKKSGQGHA